MFAEVFAGCMPGLGSLLRAVALFGVLEDRWVQTRAEGSAGCFAGTGWRRG
jgi:hypothetical protein